MLTPGGGRANSPSAQTARGPDPPGAALLGTPRRGGGGQNSRTSTRAIAALGPTSARQTANGKRQTANGKRQTPNAKRHMPHATCHMPHGAQRLCHPGRAKQWPVWMFGGASTPCGCACAGVLAGWRVCRRTHPQRGLTRRGCLNAAPQARSEFHGAPRKCPGAGVPQRCALGSQAWGRFSFGYFSLAKQRKVPRPPGRVPAPALRQEPASAKLPPSATAKAMRQNPPPISKLIAASTHRTGAKA